MKRITMIVTLLAFACLFSLPAMAQTPPPYVNVVDFGATPDQNGNDDGPAINAAIGSAYSGANPCRAVFFPQGQYVIRTTLSLNQYANSMKLFGTGSFSADPNVRPTRISWDGTAGGTVILTNYTSGLKIEDICINGDYNNDGTNKAGIGVDVSGGSACFLFSRVEVRDCTTGIKCEGGGCNSDMTFIDLSLYKDGTGFWTSANQNVNYMFVRANAVYDYTLAAANNSIGFYFQYGASVVFDNLGCGQISTAIKIDNGDVNGGNILINGWKPETYTMQNGKRMQLLDASGWATVVQVNNLCSGTNSEYNDPNTPLFKLSKSTTLLVSGSQIYGCKIATIGDGNSGCWATFDTCKFGRSGDPRIDPVITHDGYSGYELQNCEMGGGMMPNFRHDHSVLATPISPTNPNTTAGGAGVINVIWTDNATNETGFTVYMCTDGISWNQSRSAAANATSYSWNGLTTGTKYYFKVCARNGIVYSGDTAAVNRNAP